MARKTACPDLVQFEQPTNNFATGEEILQALAQAKYVDLKCL
jgi:hypothetical protein